MRKEKKTKLGKEVSVRLDTYKGVGRPRKEDYKTMRIQQTPTGSVHEVI